MVKVFKSDPYHPELLRTRTGLVWLAAAANQFPQGLGDASRL